MGSAQAILASLAAGFVVLELAAVSLVSLGALEASLLSAAARILRRGLRGSAPAQLPAAAAAAAAEAPAPPAAAPPAASRQATDQVSAEPSALTTDGSSALPLYAEPSCMAQQALDCQPSEVSFCYSNVLGDASSGDEGASAGDGAACDAASDSLAAVDEEDEGEEEGEEGEGGEGGDVLADCEGLVFEASGAVPGVRLLPRLISGLAVRTEPAAAAPGSPLLVTSYSSRFVEVVNGRVKAEPEIQPAYLSQPAEAAARSPRRQASRVLGPLGPSPSAGAL